MAAFDDSQGQEERASEAGESRCENLVRIVANLQIRENLTKIGNREAHEEDSKIMRDFQASRIVVGAVKKDSERFLVEKARACCAQEHCHQPW